MSGTRNELAELIRDNLPLVVRGQYTYLLADALIPFIEQTIAEVLRDAAYDLQRWESAEAHMGAPDCEGPHGATVAYRLFEAAIEDPAQWLLDRADKIENGTDRDSQPEPPEIFPGTRAALDRLAIRPTSEGSS